MKATIYTTAGKEVGEVTLPESVFNVAWNKDLVTQVVRAMQANARNPIAHTKTTSEVSGTGKKPWKQKGTGNARHGTRRSPIWRGGSVSHGPRNERDYSQKINKKMRNKALCAVLSKKLSDGEVLFVDALSFSEPKTKAAKEVLIHLSSVAGFEKLKSKRVNAALIAHPTRSVALEKSFRNFGNVLVEEVRNLNPVEVLRYKYLIVAAPADAVAVLEKRAGAEKTHAA